MGTIAIYCQQDELVEAAKEFAAFEALGVELLRISIVEQLREIPALEGLIMQGEGDAPALIQEARALREGPQASFLPLILLLPELNAYHRALCFDLEYTLPCSSPLLSADFIPALKKMIVFSRKRRPLIDLRERIQGNMQQKQFDKAQALIETYAQHDAEKFRAHLLKAKLGLETRDMALALGEALSAVRENNKSLEARTLLCSVYADQGEFDKAGEVLEKSAKLAPQYPPFMTLTARLALHEGKWEAAEKILSESLRLDRQQVNALAALLTVEACQDKADTLRPRVGTAAPAISRVVQVYALELARLNKVGEAEKVLQRAQQVLGPQADSYKAWMNMGLHARRLQNWKKALGFFKACAASAPADYQKVQPYIAEAEKMLQKKAS